MRKYTNYILKKLSTTLEYIISFMLAIGVILLTIKLAGSLMNIPNTSVYPNYDDLLEVCFSLIIGVELIRMIYEHSPATVFEVLLFAIARQIIVDHSSAVHSLIGVITIAILFATRKFLFCQFDEAEKIIFRANQKVDHVNKLIHVHIPSDGDETLKDLMLRKLGDANEEVGVGACVYYSDFGLRIAKLHQGEITRIEVIRSIH